MCGILCIFGISGNGTDIRKRILVLSKLQVHRGPDWSGVAIIQNKNDGLYYALAHERLAIVDLQSGEQPLVDDVDNPQVYLSANGEIYNHQILRESQENVKTYTKSDCEMILQTYMRYGPTSQTCQMLDGQFAFCIYDNRTGQYFAARDPIGIASLYYGYGRDGAMYFASEMKTLQEDCTTISIFPPGHFYSSDTCKFERYYNPPWMDIEHIPNAEPDFEMIRSLFCNAVRKRMMCDVPYGVFLSGGLDSSLVAAVAAKYSQTRTECPDEKPWWPLHSFSIGFSKSSPDLIAARQVAKHIGVAHHHEWVCSIQDGIDALRNVIYHLETYDITTIRAGTAMYLLSKRIRSMGVKCVLSGEGSDEALAGYLYFHKAPSDVELHRETVRKLKSLHQYDCLRANKATLAWSLETRVPFLDIPFLDYVMSIAPKYKMTIPEKQPIEKWLLRKAFSEGSWIPDDILWRQKEQFSDGVGYSWIDELRIYTESQVSDIQMKHAMHRYPHNTPQTKEGYYYRMVFENVFANPISVMTVPGGPSIACSSSTAVEWDKAWASRADPSGRAISSHCGVAPPTLVL